MSNSTQNERDAVRIGKQQEPFPIAFTFDFTKSSWGYAVRFAIGWMFAPLFCILSKLLKKIIQL